MKNKPKLGEPYWFFDENTLETRLDNWCDTDVDKDRLAIGNCFGALKEAEDAAPKVLTLIHMGKRRLNNEMLQTN